MANLRDLKFQLGGPVVSVLRHLPGAIGAPFETRYGYFQTWQALRIFDDILKGAGPSDICFDFGANVGEVSQRIAATGCQVIAYEPDPDTFAILSENMKSMENVTCRNAAVSAETGEVSIYRAPDFASDPIEKSVSTSMVRTKNNVDPSSAITVAADGICDIIDQAGSDIFIVKMDIEGAEIEVLQKLFASPQIHKIKYLFVETHVGSIPEQAVPLAALKATARSLPSTYVNFDWV